MALACVLILATRLPKFDIKVGKVLSTVDKPGTKLTLPARSAVKFVGKGLLVAEEMAAVISVLTPMPSPCVKPEVAISTVGVKGIISI
jgi:hypothetical protein